MRKRLNAGLVAAMVIFVTTAAYQLVWAACPEKRPFSISCPDTAPACGFDPRGVCVGPGSTIGNGNWDCAENNDNNNQTQCVGGTIGADGMTNNPICYTQYSACQENVTTGVCGPDATSTITYNRKVVKIILPCDVT